MLADLSMEEFLALNPAFRRRVIHTDTPGVLLLPADKVEVFHYNLKRLANQADNLQTYHGRRGDSVAAIARRFGVSMTWLKEHNPLRLANGKLVTDQVLYVPRQVEFAPARLVRSAPNDGGKVGGTKRDGKTKGNSA